MNQNGVHMLLETLIRMPHISLSVGVAYMGVDDNFILRHLRDFRRLKAKWSRLFALNLISLWRVGSGVWRVVRGQIRILIHKMFDCLDSTCFSNGIAYNGNFSMWVKQTRSSWFNCALRGDEAVYWVSIGQQWLVYSGTGVSMRRYQLVNDLTESGEGIHAFIHYKKWRSGQVLPMPHRLTDFER